MKIKSKIDLKILIIMILYLLICFISSIVMFGTLQVRNGLMAILFMVFPVLLVIASKVLKFELTTLFTTLILLLALGGLTGTIYELIKQKKRLIKVGQMIQNIVLLMKTI